MSYEAEWAIAKAASGYAELRTLATAALTHRHTAECYRNGSGPWCVFEPTNIDHWTVLLGLLDKLERYEPVKQRARILLAALHNEAGLMLGTQYAADALNTALNPTEANDD